MIYVFGFNPRYASQSATVTDYSGTEVASSPITLDSAGNGRLDLDEGNYLAAVSKETINAGSGYSVIAGVLDIPASIDASGEGPVPISYVLAGAGPFSVAADDLVNVVFEVDGGNDGTGEGNPPSWHGIDSGDNTITELGLYAFTLTMSASVSDTTLRLGTAPSGGGGAHYQYVTAGRADFGEGEVYKATLGGVLAFYDFEDAGTSWITVLAGNYNAASSDVNVTLKLDQIAKF